MLENPKCTCYWSELWTCASPDMFTLRWSQQPARGQTRSRPLRASSSCWHWEDEKEQDLGTESFCPPQRDFEWVQRLFCFHFSEGISEGRINIFTTSKDIWSWKRFCFRYWKLKTGCMSDKTELNSCTMHIFRLQKRNHTSQTVLPSSVQTETCIIYRKFPLSRPQLV